MCHLCLSPALPGVDHGPYMAWSMVYVQVMGVDGDCGPLAGRHGQAASGVHHIGARQALEWCDCGAFAVVPA